MPFAVIDGINTRYDVLGSGPPLFMFSPGGFDGTLEKWTTAGVYARTRMLDHLRQKFSRIIFDRRETGQTEETAGPRLLEFLDKETSAAR